MRTQVLALLLISCCFTSVSLADHFLDESELTNTHIFEDTADSSSADDVDCVLDTLTVKKKHLGYQGGTENNVTVGEVAHACIPYPDCLKAHGKKLDDDSIYYFRRRTVGETEYLERMCTICIMNAATCDCKRVRP